MECGGDSDPEESTNVYENDFDDLSTDNSFTRACNDGEDDEYVPPSGTIASHAGWEANSRQMLPSTTVPTDLTASSALGIDYSYSNHPAEVPYDVALNNYKTAKLLDAKSIENDCHQPAQSLFLLMNGQMQSLINFHYNTQKLQRQTFHEMPPSVAESPKRPHVKDPEQDHTPGNLESESEIEEKVMKFHHMIVQCVKEPTVVSYLSTVLSADESYHLKQIFVKSSGGAEELIEALRISDVTGKWTAFVNALKHAGYPNLVDHLLNKENTRHDEEYERKMIQIFSPAIEKNLMVLDILSELSSSDVITEIDKQEVRATLESKGNPYATVVLLDRMQCRKAPGEWYSIFLNVLQEKGYDELVQMIEPDYIRNPSKFLNRSDYKRAFKYQLMLEMRQTPDKEYDTDFDKGIFNITDNARATVNETRQGMLQTRVKDKQNVFGKDTVNTQDIGVFTSQLVTLMQQTVNENRHLGIGNDMVSFKDENQMDEKDSSPQQMEHICHDHGHCYTHYCENHDLVCCDVCAQLRHGGCCKGKVHAITDVARNISKDEKFDNFKHELEHACALVDHEKQAQIRHTSKLHQSKIHDKHLTECLKRRAEIAVKNFEKTLSEIDERYTKAEAENRDDIQTCADIEDKIHQMTLDANSPTDSTKFIAMKICRSELLECVEKLNGFKHKRKVGQQRQQMFVSELSSEWENPF